ncbi:MAG: ABC transporter ATP-binding protein [Erysipelotrichaceae bacterium]
MQNIIEVNQLRKSFGEIRAINGINLHIPKGTFTAFLGENGAGKSTTIDILCTLCDFDEGSVIIDGYHRYHQDNQIRERIGIVFQDSALDDLLTLKENLRIRSRFYHLNKEQRTLRIKEISDLLSLDKFINQKVGTLSGGQKRKGDIARALLSNPSLLILDEATTGLDPKARLQIWECIKLLQLKRKISIFLTTHYIEEAAFADKIIIIQKGKIIEEGTPSSLRDKYTKDYLVLYPHHFNRLETILKEHRIEYETDYPRILIKVITCFDSINIIQRYQIYLKSFEVKLGTLEDAFLSILKQ